MQLVWAEGNQAGIVRQTGAWAMPEKRKNTRRQNETPYMGCQSKNLIAKQTYRHTNPGDQGITDKPSISSWNRMKNCRCGYVISTAAIYAAHFNYIISEDLI